MNFHPRVLPAAADDVAEAQRWYEKQREGLGVEFVREVDAALELVARNPLWRPAGYRGTRHAPVNRFPYVIHYRISGNSIEVFAILHSKRDPRMWRSRTK
jgi:plasmid stabilization system protein ParE